MLLTKCVTKATVLCIKSFSINDQPAGLLSDDWISHIHQVIFGWLTLCDLGYYSLKGTKSKQITWMVSCLILQLFKVEPQGLRLPCCTWHHPLILAKRCCMLANVTAWQPFSHVGTQAAWGVTCGKAPAESTLRIKCLLLQITLRLWRDPQRGSCGCKTVWMHHFSLLS